MMASKIRFASKAWAYAALVICGAAGIVHGQSLYDPATYKPLATDLRAARVGDSLTILIYESATATSRADTSADRKSTFDARASDLDEVVGGRYASSNEFDGGGVERRSGEVVARVSVTVREVMDNGDLFVQGTQQIALNNESQHITVAGRLRPQDILADNTVLSSRLSDAKIEFKGRGLLTAREKPGLLARFFHWLL